MEHSDTQSFIPYGRQTITKADIEAVEAVLQSSYLTQGPIVPEFERSICKTVKSHYAIAVNSSTSALHLACLSLGLGAGDRLWTSPITFVASANCARYCGASVDFVDIDPNTGLMSIEELSAKLKAAARNGSLPKVLVPVHLCGTSCDMKGIAELAKYYGVSILEDASHAIGGSYCSQPVGSCSHSDISVFSFHPVKIITTGEGGTATTNDPNLAQKIVDLRSHGIIKDPSRFEYSPSGPWSYEQQSLGFNYRLTEIQAALGLSQLNRLSEIVLERQKLFKLYQDKIQALPVKLLSIPKNVDSSVHLAVIRLNNTDPSHHRKVFDGLRSANIGVQLHYTPVHLQPYYRRLGFKEGDFPFSESYASNAISLPLYPGLNEIEQDRVVEVLSTLLM